MRQVVWNAVLVTAVATLLAAFILPAAALLRESFAALHAGDATLALGPRQWGLVWRGLWLAVAGTTGAMLVGAGLAAGVLSRRGPIRSFVVAACLWTLATPTYLLAYAWGLIALPEGLFSAAPAAREAPAWFAREGRAILCLATWLSPVAAAAIAAGWRARGASLYQLARLDADGFGAVCVGVWGGMRRVVLATVLLCLVLALTDYAIPHLCQVYTWNTELLAELQALHQPALAAAWPLVCLAAGLITVAGLAARSFMDDGAWKDESTGLSGVRAWPALLTASVLLAPVAILLLHLRSPSAIWRVWSTYQAEWITAAPIGLTAAAGAMALAIATGRLMISRHTAAVIAGRSLLALLIFAAAMPPVVVGEGVLLAFADVDWVRDSVLAISLCGIARYSAIPALALWGNLRGTQEQIAQGAIDGATKTATYLHVLLPQNAWLLSVCGVFCALLSATEIGAAQLVTTPGVSSLAQTMLNEIHFGRDDQIIAISLWILTVCAVVAIGSMLIGRKRRVERVSVEAPRPGRQ